MSRHWFSVVLLCSGTFKESTTKGESFASGLKWHVKHSICEVRHPLNRKMSTLPIFGVMLAVWDVVVFRTCSYSSHKRSNTICRNSCASCCRLLIGERNIHSMSRIKDRGDIDLALWVEFSRRSRNLVRACVSVVVYGSSGVLSSSSSTSPPSCWLRRSSRARKKLLPFRAWSTAFI